MQNIQMVDLHGQYLRIKEDVDKAIHSVIDNSSFINGEPVKLLEKELAQYLGVKHAVACANGTDAITIALMSLGLQPGDEIITTNFTFIATVEAIALLQLKPVLVDVDPHTFCIDIQSLEDHISPITKAIIPVHLFGQGARMNEILTIAKEYNLYVIEDGAQCFGASYEMKFQSRKKLCTFGDIGITSFFPSKNLGCFGDGGALFTDNDILAEKIRMIANHGSRMKYYHEIIGMNSRLDTIQAAILREKLKHIEDYNSARICAAGYYDDKLRNVEWIQIPFRNPESTHVFHQYTILLKEDENVKVQDFLKKKGIPTMIYYPLPMHLQKAYAPYLEKNRKYPVSEMLMKRVLSLPMHTELTNEQLDYITNSLISYKA